MVRAWSSIGHYQFDLTRFDAGQLIHSTVDEALARSNSGGFRNTYLWQDLTWTRNEAANAVSANVSQRKGMFGTFNQYPILWGVPVSVKDCFDLKGAPTSCGTHFYAHHNGSAGEDSWLVKQLRNSGAVIIGKTHLHPLAYGITGENPEFGDCLQPGDPGALTGGSSSGAAASILEHSAMAAVGTDTGGSIRVPAALCGLAGYRASVGIGDWSGAAHLAPSFDTMGWIFRSFADGTMLARTLDFKMGRAPDAGIEEFMRYQHLLRNPTRFAVVAPSFLLDCEPAVVESLRQARAKLENHGLEAHVVEVDWWADSVEIFAAIQASEAAEIHHGHFARFEPSIRQRLEWGASLSAGDLTVLRQRHRVFRDRMDALLDEHHFLLMPAAPVTRLSAGADHSQTRTRLLRYTTPVSLAGMPAVTLPAIREGVNAGGMQLAAARGNDERLLALAASLESGRTAGWVQRRTLQK